MTAPVVTADSGHARVAFVTGGGSGIGKAASLAWAKAGIRVMLADIDDGAAHQTVDEIQSTGGVAACLHLDVRDDKACSDAVEQTLNRYGRLDIGFNNAGITGSSAKVSRYDIADWRNVIEVNLIGVFNCMQAELKVFERQGSGVIINTSSVIGMRGTAGGSAYSAAKHGVLGLTRSAALEYAAKGIRINAVCPGFVQTQLVVGQHAGIPGNILEEKLTRTAVRRLGQPEEIAAAVLWLASDAASFVHGAALSIDGGYLAS